MKTVTHAGRKYLAATLTLLSFGMAGLVSTTSAQATAAAQSSVQTSLNAELKGSLDSKHAQVGQQVMASTTAKAMVGETALPKGTQLLGHVTSVSQYAKGESQGEVGMVFDQARLKDGTIVPIHSSLRSIAPPVSAQASSQTDVSAGPAYVGASGGGSVRGGGLLRGTTAAVGGVASGLTSTTRGVVGGAANTGSAAVGGVAHTTGGLVAGVSNVPGVALSTGVDASTSGVVSAAGRDVKLESGTQLALGVVVQ